MFVFSIPTFFFICRTDSILQLHIYYDDSIVEKKNMISIHFYINTNLAAFTRADAIVVTRTFVAAHHTGFVHPWGQRGGHSSGVRVEEGGGVVGGVHRRGVTVKHASRYWGEKR